MIGSDNENAVDRAHGVLEVLGEAGSSARDRCAVLTPWSPTKALNNFVGGGTYALVVEALYDRP